MTTSSVDLVALLPLLESSLRSARGSQGKCPTYWHSVSGTGAVRATSVLPCSGSLCGENRLFSVAPKEPLPPSMSLKGIAAAVAITAFC